MKSILLFGLFVLAYGLSFGQAKLLSQSRYDYDTATTTFVRTDSTKYFYSPLNTTSAVQHHDESYVSSKADSSWQYSTDGTVFFKSAVTYDSYTPSYSATLHYHDSIYNSSGIGVYSSQSDYYHNGTNYDSSIHRLTVLATATTSINRKQYFHQDAQANIDTFWSIYLGTGGTYSSSNKQVSVYNANNLITQNYSYNSSDSVNYIPSSRLDYFYTANNLIDSMEAFAYVAPNWVKVGARHYTYNSSNARTKMEYRHYDATSQIYTPLNREEYLRMNGTLIDTLYSQLWNSGFSKYDTTVKRGYIIQGGLLKHMYSYVYDVPNSQWIYNPYGALFNYYYDMVIDKLPTHTSKSVFSLYPNPSSNSLSLQPAMPDARYSIIGLDGKLVAYGTLDDRNTIPIHTLTKGSYFLFVDDGENTASQLFMKQE